MSVHSEPCAVCGETLFTYLVAGAATCSPCHVDPRAGEGGITRSRPRTVRPRRTPKRAIRRIETDPTLSWAEGSTLPKGGQRCA